MNSILTFLPLIGVLLLVFLLLREIVLWYYRINERINLQKENNELQKQISWKLGMILSKLTLESSSDETNKMVYSELHNFLKKGSIIIKEKATGKFSTILSSDKSKLKTDLFEIVEEK
jgi:hypothetical protein